MLLTDSLRPLSEHHGAQLLSPAPPRTFLPHGAAPGQTSSPQAAGVGAAPQQHRGGCGCVGSWRRAEAHSEGRGLPLDLALGPTPAPFPPGKPGARQELALRSRSACVPGSPRGTGAAPQPQETARGKEGRGNSPPATSVFTPQNQGRARTQSPTTTNYAVEFPAFGEIAGVSTPGVQGMSLALGKPPA